MIMTSRRLNRIAVAFNEDAARAPRRLCESSGSDHSPEDPDDLSDLVNSFLETDCGVETDQVIDQEQDDIDDEADGYWSESETKRSRLNSLLSNTHNGIEEMNVMQNIRHEAELACGDIFLGSNRLFHDDFKRHLMSRLRHKGFDAGLCKTRWETVGPLPGGNYEYVDVNVNGSRYIVEVNLAAEFETARPTAGYASLLEVFPTIFVGKPKELKQIVKLLCKAIRESMKSNDMHIPPWRRSGYMQAKWLSGYKRTVNASPFNDSASAKKGVGLEAVPVPTISFRCRDNFASKAGPKVGYLAAALQR